ncbi:MAG: hypothetical protein FWE27_04950 [Defluviitaleaceae bacterium]|nr:hypothetical protein [Defluviitaleaceae bacterium]
MADFLLHWLPLVIIVFVALIFSVTLATATTSRKGKFDEEASKDENFKTDYSRLINIYEFLTRFPLTSKSTNQLFNIIAGLSLYNNVEQRAETAKLAAISYVIMIVALTTTIVFTGAEPISSVAAFVIAIAIRRDFVNKRLLKKRAKFREELLTTLMSLQQEYIRVKNLKMAIIQCESTELTRFLMTNVENIVNTEDPDAALNYFCLNNPYHICVRLANLCFNTFKYNAHFDELKGADTFVTNMDEIIADLLRDIDLANEEKKKFHSVEKLPLFGLVIAFAAPMFMTSQIPGLRFFYNTGLAWVIQVVTIAMVLFAFVRAIKLNDFDDAREDVTVWELKRWANEKWKNKWEARAARKTYYLQDLIQRSLSYLTPGMVHFRRTLVGLFGFFLTLAVFATFLHVHRQGIMENFRDLPDSTLEMLELHFQDYSITITSDVLQPARREGAVMTYYEIQDWVEGRGWNLTGSEIEIMAAQIYSNQNTLLGTRWELWWLLVAFIVMLIGFYIPIHTLKKRIKLVERETKFEVVLLQSVVVQLMYTPLKLKDYLLFFSSISRLYATTHLYSYVRQFNHPEDLKDAAVKMTDNNYYQIMEQMYSLHSSMTPRALFRETAANRKYLAEKNLAMNKEHLEKSYIQMSMLLKASLFVPIITQVIVPLGTFVIETLIEQMGNL